MGSHIICAEGITVVYDSLTSRWDTCTNTFCDSVVINPSSINRINAIAEFDLFPNPTSDKLNIKLLAEKNIEGQIIVRDLLGKVVVTLPLNIQANETTRKTIDVSNYVGGAYFISVGDNNKNQTIRTMRFIKK